MDADQNEKTRQRIRDEASRIEEASLWAAERHYAAETPWFMINFWLGIPSVILAAIASAAAFSDVQSSKLVAGGVSLAVAALTALLTFLDPHKRAHLHHETAKQYEALYHQAGFFNRIQTQDTNCTTDDLAKVLTAFHARFNEINQGSPSVPCRAYRVAERHIKSHKGEVVRSLAERGGDRP